jgi:hypothetical protein
MPLAVAVVLCVVGVTGVIAASAYLIDMSVRHRERKGKHD